MIDIREYDVPYHVRFAIDTGAPQPPLLLSQQLQIAKLLQSSIRWRTRATLTAVALRCSLLLRRVAATAARITSSCPVCRSAVSPVSSPCFHPLQAPAARGGIQSPPAPPA